MRRSALLMLFALVAVPASAQPAPDTLEIYPVHGSDAELQIVSELRDVIAAHDLRDWEVAPVVRIDETQIPHSHPVLTLHTRYLGNPDGLLAVYLHEQFHWWVIERAEALDAARAELRETYPDAPLDRPLGAGSARSTYLHLVVCHLEYQAMRALVGEQRARQALAANNHYTWIYERVLNDPSLTELLRRHGFALE